VKEVLEQEVKELAEEWYKREGLAGYNRRRAVGFDLSARSEDANPDTEGKGSTGRKRGLFKEL
jgi:hypothetical protein